MRNGWVEYVMLIAATTLAVACSPKHATVSYSNDVQPVLTKKCSGCHAPDQPGFTSSGLDTTSHAALMKGGKQGALIEPGDEFSSTRKLFFTGKSHGRKQLSNDEFGIFKVWVCEGAKNN